MNRWYHRRYRARPLGLSLQRPAAVRINVAPELLAGRSDQGRRIAVFFTETYTRILNPTLAELDPKLPAEIATRSPLAHSWKALETALDQLTPTFA